jgi:RNA polymerase sigma-70 factor (ECF subfamily)
LSPDQAAHAHLIERVKASEMQAFKILFEEFQPVLFRNVLYQLRDPDLAHDIVQETFIRVWQHRSRLKPHLPFLPYLFRISGNLIKDHFKYKSVRTRYESDVPPPEKSEKDDPEAAFQVGALEEEIMNTVNKHLPERCRAVFLLSRIEGKSHAEIARILGIAPKTVENQIGYALVILRRKLAHYLSPKH